MIVVFPFVVAFATMGLGLGVLAFAGNATLAVPALMVSGIGMGWLVPNFMATLTDAVADADRGRIIGVVQGAMTIAPLIGLSLLEPLLPRIGTAGVLAGIALLSLVYAVWYAAFVRRPRAA